MPFPPTMRGRFREFLELSLRPFWWAASCAWPSSLWWRIALGGVHCVGGIQQAPSEFRPEPLTISLGLNALRYVVDRSPGRPLSARANVPTTAVPFYLIFCALAQIVATHQERSGTLTNLPHCGKVVSTQVGCGRNLAANITERRQSSAPN